MSYSGLSPKANRIRFQPRSSDPVNPVEGDVQYADGTARSAGLWAYKSGNWTQVGSGAGSGGINYILNPDAETNTQGWSTYADAAGSSPVDGTGGSPNSTWTRSTSSPLRTTGSFLFTHNSGASRQGEGVSYAFTIDSADQARVVQISFDYIIGSGTFTAGTASTDSDLTVWIYDVTNATVIQPSTFRLPSSSSTISDKFSATFQTASNSTSYRLIVHCSTTSTSAFTVKFDNFKVGPQDVPIGSIVTDWKDAGTVTITGSTTNPTKGTVLQDKFRWRRVGGNMEFQYTYEQSTAGTNGSGDYIFSIPSSIGQIDTSLVPINNTIGTSSAMDPSIIGTAGAGAPGVAAGPGYVSVYSSTQFRLSIISGTTCQAVNSGFFNMGLSNQMYNAVGSVPMVGWASSVQMSSETSTRVVSFSGTQSSQAVTANVTNISFTSTRDSHGAWNGSQYVVPVPGDYYVTFTGQTSGAAASQGYLNGTAVQGLGVNAGATGISPYSMLFTSLKVGDLVSVRMNASVTITNGAMSVYRISGPSQIAASENIIASYYASSNAAGTASAPFNFDTRIVDTHSAVTTGASWVFTAPAPGVYSIMLQGLNASAINENLNLYKNGSIFMSGGRATSSQAANFVANINLVSGDTIQIRPGSAITLTGGALSANGVSSIHISRIGRPF